MSIVWCLPKMEWLRSGTGGGNSKPDLILMDLSLPRMDGWEATRRLKADAATARIPLIVLSAHAMNGDEDRARAAGCDDFLTKPIDETVLFQTIARHLGN